jgi:hypothetical protein
MLLMPRDGAIIFADLIGKVDVLVHSLPQMQPRWVTFTWEARPNSMHDAADGALSLCGQ